MPEENALYKAVYSNNLEKVKYLLDHGADPNARSRFGNPPLHRACHRGFSGIARLLLSHDADVNAKDMNGVSPLHWACIRGNTAIARYLIEAGADVNARDRKGRAPLHHACQGSVVSVNGVKELLDHGADVSTADNNGHTPLDLILRLSTSNPARETILGFFRNLAPELVMEAFCTRGPQL